MEPGETFTPDWWRRFVEDVLVLPFGRLSSVFEGLIVADRPATDQN